MRAWTVLCLLTAMNMCVTAGEDFWQTETTFSPSISKTNAGVGAGMTARKGGANIYGKLQLSQQFLDDIAAGTSIEMGFSHKGRIAKDRLTSTLSGDYKKDGSAAGTVKLQHVLSGRFKKARFRHHLTYLSGKAGRRLDGHLTTRGKLGRVAVKQQLRYRLAEDFRVRDLTLSFSRSFGKHLKTSLTTRYAPELNTTHSSFHLSMDTAGSMATAGINAKLKVGHNTHEGSSFSLSMRIKSGGRR